LSPDCLLNGSRPQKQLTAPSHAPRVELNPFVPSDGRRDAGRLLRCAAMTAFAQNPVTLLENSLASGRIHSAYLISGAGEKPRETALWFARAIACAQRATARGPCENCPACRRSGAEVAEIAIEDVDKGGPAFRHIGEHADLYWVERAEDKTRVTVQQVRAIEQTVRRPSIEGGARVAVIHDAEWLNAEAANGLLRILEEPPPETTFILVAPSPGSLLTTIRSRSIRVAFPAEESIPLRDATTDENVAELVGQLDGIARLRLPELINWAEKYRGGRAQAAAGVDALLDVGQLWLRERITQATQEGRKDLDRELDAFATLGECRRDLATRNAQPRMVAERGLFAIRGAIRS
jgi:hypothetical protein